MRVLHAISGLDPVAGGVATALKGLAMAQRCAGGADLTVVSTWGKAKGQQVAEELAGMGIRVHLLGPTMGPLSSHAGLRPVLAEQLAACDVAHIHGLWEDIQHQTARVARQLNVPYIFTPHGMLDPWSLSQSKWKKRLYMLWRLRRDLNEASAIHFTATAERDLVRPLNLKAPAIVQPNGIDLAEFRELPARGSFVARHPGIAGKFLVLSLGRLHPKKGLELLIPAFARAGIANSMLVIAGPDSNNYQAKLQQLAGEMGIAERVVFTGMLYGRERIEAMVDADIFVLPSYQENFGIAVAEALAAGTPVIVSDQVNIHSDIAAAGVGSVVPTQIEPLTEQLKRWAADNELRRSAASKARPFVQARYDWANIAKEWIKHYETIVAASKNR